MKWWKKARACVCVYVPKVVFVCSCAQLQRLTPFQMRTMPCIPPPPMCRMCRALLQIDRCVLQCEQHCPSLLFPTAFDAVATCALGGGESHTQRHACVDALTTWAAAAVKRSVPLCVRE